VTYLGYPNTTGLRSVDYRITDEWADPAGLSEHLHTERLLRLPSGFVCYQPPAESPPVGPTPALRNQCVTFGSFNALPKLTPRVVSVWASILHAVPGSRLLLKAAPLRSALVRDRVEALFMTNGINRERLSLRGHARSLAEHLSTYDEIDIGLDPFPYNGTTTTCEALWMGVPVVARAGNAHVGRVGVSILSRVGMGHLHADSDAAYEALAVMLAGDIGQLQRQRATMRDRLRQSSLLDAKQLTADLEQAYLAMWSAPISSNNT
jgi:predicted O-linked N-acetylglucosamine transferase (SPINDLY family)